MAAHRHSLETGEPFGMEYRLVARDGRVVWFLDRASVVRGQSGTPAFHHGVYLDSGLRGLYDRVAAVDGHLELYSPLGGGKRVSCELPCA